MVALFSQTLLFAVFAFAAGTDDGSYTVGQFSTLSHGVSSGAVVVTPPRNITIRDLHYDGQGPDAYFVVGKGQGPNKDPNSYQKIPNEKGSLGILSVYNGETITLQLPMNLTVEDVDYLSIYCVKFDHHFGQVRLRRTTSHASHMTSIHEFIVIAGSIFLAVYYS